MTKLRIFLVVLFIVVVAVLIVFPYRNKAAVAIAFLGDLKGAHSDISACNGATLAVNAVNARGGIKGRQLKLTIHDYKGQPEKLPGICSSVKAGRSHILLAPYPPREKLADCVAKEQILPLTFGFSTVSEGTGSLNFHPMALSSGEALAGLALIREIRHLVVVHDRATYPFGLAFLEGFRDRYQESGGQLDQELEIDSKAEGGLAGLGEKVFLESSQGVLIIASGETTARIGRMVRAKQPGVALFAAPWALAHATDTALAPDNFTGLEGMCTYARKSAGMGVSGMTDFCASYRKRFGVPADLSAVFGYEAVLILAEGIRNSASPDPFLVKHTLEKMFRFKGMVSDYTLGGKKAETKGLVLLEVRGGLVTEV